MPKRLPFVIVKAFKSEDDFISWQKEQNFSWSITKSNKSKCTLCTSCQHQININYAFCNNADCNKGLFLNVYEIQGKNWSMVTSCVVLARMSIATNNNLGKQKSYVSTQLQHVLLTTSDLGVLKSFHRSFELFEKKNEK